MKFNPLDSIPLKVRAIQTLSKGTKEYNKSIKELRLILWGYVLDLLKRSKPGEIFYYLKVKRIRYLIPLYTMFSIIMILLIVSGFIFGDKDTSEFTQRQAIEAITLISVMIIIGVIGVYFGIKSKIVIDECIGILVEQTKTNCPNFSDELLTSISKAYQFSMNNYKIARSRQKCGCINCKTIFYSDEIKDTNHRAVTCPYCSTQNVIAESSGYPITNDFLNAMKEYWIDELN